MKKLTLIISLLCGTAHAEFYTGNDLYNKLISDNAIERMVGLGFVIGVFDTAQSVAHCAPDNITAGQVRDMVRQHLEATPSVRHYAAEVQVRYVLSRAWPCPKKNGSAL